MSYTLNYTKRFEKDVTACRKAGRDLESLWAVVEILSEEGKLPEEYMPHMLTEEYAGLWECHIEDDWLLLWRQDDKRLTLLLTNTGTHEELFHPIKGKKK